MTATETVDQIRDRIFNPKPAITHCPCGHSLERCLKISTGGGGVCTSDAHYSEFLKMVPEWFLEVLAEAGNA